MEHDSAEFLPPLAISAQSLAIRTRKRRKRLVALRLVLVTLAALFGALSIAGHYKTQRLDYAGVAGVLAFIGVLGVRLAMQNDPELKDAEPRGNAVSDLATSHAWRYAVGARPYAVGSPELDDVANNQFGERMRSYQQILSNYSITSRVSQQITDEMKRIRASELSYRRNFYITERIESLQAANSSDSVRLGGRWRVLTALVLLVELLGIPGGVLKAIDLSRIDLLGVTAAAAASIALWVDTLNFQERRRAAAALSNNLVSAHDDLDIVKTEAEWAAMVADIEEQLSLESEALLSTATQRSNSHRDDIRTMSPAEYFAAAATLKRQIWDQSDKLSKLEPDVIVAVNPGGAILGGILYFMTRTAFVPLTLRGTLHKVDLENMLKTVPWQPKKAHLSLLLVDASIKSGENMKQAVDMVREAVESKGFVAEANGDRLHSSSAPRYVLRTAVIAKRSDPNHELPVQVDYFVNETTDRFPYGNV